MISFYNKCVFTTILGPHLTCLVGLLPWHPQLLQTVFCDIFFFFHSFDTVAGFKVSLNLIWLFLYFSGSISSLWHDRVLRVGHTPQHLLQQAHWHTGMAGRSSHDEKGEGCRAYHCMQKKTSAHVIWFKGHLLSEHSRGLRVFFIMPRMNIIVRRRQSSQKHSDPTFHRKTVCKVSCQFLRPLQLIKTLGYLH